MGRSPEQQQSGGNQPVRSGGIIKDRGLERDYARGGLRPNKIDLSKGMPGAAALVRDMILDKTRTVPFREGYLISVDEQISKMAGGASSFLNTYHWRYKVFFEQDVRGAIKRGHLSQGILERLPNLLPLQFAKISWDKKVAILVQSKLTSLKAQTRPSNSDIFLEWAFANWAYFKSHPYTHKAFSPVDGLFFFEPPKQQNFDTYQKDLFQKFNWSITETGKILGLAAGHRAFAAHPVHAGVSLSRWIALDTALQVRGKKLSACPGFAFLSGLPAQLRELRRLLNLSYDYYKRPQPGRPRWPSKEILKEINDKLVRDKVPKVP